MTRADAIAWLTPFYGDIYTRGGMTTDDTPTGFGPALDDALILLGLTTTDAFPADAVDKTYAALRYTALRRVRIRFAARYSKNINGLSLSTFQTWQALNTEYTEAKNDLARWGLGGVGPDGQIMLPPSYDEIELNPQRTKPNPRFAGTWDELA